MAALPIVSGTLLLIGGGILTFAIVGLKDKQPTDDENVTFVPTPSSPSSLPETQTSPTDYYPDTQTPPSPTDYYPDIPPPPPTDTGNGMDPSPPRPTQFDTLAIGEYCVSDGECSAVMTAGGPPASSKTLVGCCSNNCGFRRKNWRKKYKCMSDCRTCATCRYGAKSKKPCKMTQQEIDYRGLRLNQRRPISMYGQNDQYLMSMDQFAYNNMDAFGNVNQ